MESDAITSSAPPKGCSAAPVDRLISYYDIFLTGMFTFAFAVPLLIAPAFFFGPPSPLMYWKVWAAEDEMTGRGVATQFISLTFVGYFLHGTAGFTKQMTVFNIGISALFCLPPFLGTQGDVVTWYPQLALAVVLVSLGVYFEVIGATGSWTPKFSMLSPIGLNVATLNAFNLVFFGPLLPGFLYDVNLFWGPNGFLGPIGLSLFLEDFPEPGFWFHKVWAILIFCQITGPYLFGLEPLQVAKQFAVSNFLGALLFTYQFIISGILNPLTLGPVVVTQFALSGVGLYLALPANSGVPMF